MPTSNDAAYQDFLEYLVKGIVDHPEAVEVQHKIDEMGVLLTLKVHKEDMGKVVGRNGGTARAIRTLLRIVGIKSNARVNLKIAEPEGSTHVPQGANAGMNEDDEPDRPAQRQTVDQMVEDLKL